MKIGKRLAAALLAACMVFVLCGCTTNTSQIKDTLTEFQYACHNLDLKAMLRCIDPEISDPIRLGLSAYGAVTGEDTDDLLGKAVAAVFGTSFDAKEFLDRLTVKEPKVKVKKKNATVTCKLGFLVGGESFERKTTIRLRKVEDKWYISGIELGDELED